MRKTKTRGWLLRNSSDVPVRALRIAAVALGIGVVMTVGVARAQDDDNDDRTFEEKIIGDIMSGIGATNMENRGIDYRERSPLVVPPNLDLPPPASTSAEVNVPNWPKDPDEARRKKAIAARKKANKDPIEAARVLKPSELNVARTAPGTSGGTAVSDSAVPGAGNANPLSPSQLGYNGGLLGMFHGNTAESAPFTGEPDRESLTQPPVGYQTPSPNFAYGTGPKESLNKTFDPYDQASH
ncbi:MAG: hypothetical protein KGK01_10240 [Bradyrhizobium sp.]|uniref:hypothetical protein n=1 Tax=Bradyrhizobium sp. TaxID=376 RepID=UPI001EC6CB79|nr:hypothetical protein [Bradyrhizobium sp.]MBU6456661.1 hypothetical protein [Bradyrhizobium sp.]MDE2069467.1 hypothetical protein [Bradyrhizobium sp.]MDE2242797.1 hypothetical protein [Bradyrhizobium sp.]MDE2469003.1 hypothetical protein [Bradyrhizobium sp.]